MSAFGFLNFVSEFCRTRERARAIKNDPERQPKSIRFGVSSIISAALCLAFGFVIAYGIRMMTEDDQWVTMSVLGLVVLVIGIGGVLGGLYKAIECWAFQLYINKRPITWISLIVWIAAIAGVVVIVILFV